MSLDGRLGPNALKQGGFTETGASISESHRVESAGSPRQSKPAPGPGSRQTGKTISGKTSSGNAISGPTISGKADPAPETSPGPGSFRDVNKVIRTVIDIGRQQHAEAGAAAGAGQKVPSASKDLDRFANAAWHAAGKSSAVPQMETGQIATGKSDPRQTDTGKSDTGQTATGKSDTGQADAAQTNTGQTDTGQTDIDGMRAGAQSPAARSAVLSAFVETNQAIRAMSELGGHAPAAATPDPVRPSSRQEADEKPGKIPSSERHATGPELRFVGKETTAKAGGAEPLEKTPAGRVDPVPDTSPAKDQPSPEIVNPPLRGRQKSKQETLRPVDGGSGGGGRSGTGGGSGGGGGGRGPGDGGAAAAPNLGQRYFDQNFRDVLTKGLARSRRNLVSVGIFSFFVNLLVLSIPVYLFQISDRVLTSRSVDTLVMLSGLVIGFLLIHVLLDMVRRFVLMRIAVDTEMRLGPSVLSAAARASQNGSNREYQTLGDLQQLRNFITGPVLLNIFDIPVIPIYLLAVYLIHPQLGYIVTCTGGALFIIALINQKLTAVPFGQANAYGTRANLQADAMSRNAQVINAMGMIPEGVQIWGRETMESLKAQVIAQDRNVLMSAISKFIRLCTQIALLGWGAWLALHSELTGGMLIAASIVGSRALAPIEGAIEGWRGFIQARSSYARIRTLLLNSPLNFERLRLPKAEGRVTVERVLYVPPPTKKVILNGISFHLEPGDSLAIVGASGSGKSTLGRMLVGSIVPTAGNVRLDHMDLRNWDPRQFGESVGYLPQDVQLFPATIKANISRMREDATDEKIFDAAETADVHEMISQFAAGYETLIGVDGAPLSGGQKQRIGLARAFYGDPRMVVLDEPNSNLDVPGERALARALMRAKAKDITVIAITQRPSLLKHVDKIMMLKDGTVQAFGPRDEMLEMMRKGSALEGGGGTSLPPQNQT